MAVRRGQSLHVTVLGQQPRVATWVRACDVQLRGTTSYDEIVGYVPSRPRALLLRASRFGESAVALAERTVRTYERRDLAGTMLDSLMAGRAAAAG